MNHTAKGQTTLTRLGSAVDATPEAERQEMVAIGLGAAAVGFLIGRLFHTA
jgi:VIT1/CCC1 family predicted Fe2+/Mn2+ transporter